MTLQAKIEVSLIVGDHYKSIRGAACIFNSRHPNKVVCIANIGNVMNKFNATGSAENKFMKNHNRRKAIKFRILHLENYQK